MNAIRFLRHSLLVSLLIISGCGFQLRGTVDVPEDWMRLHLRTANPNSELTGATINGFTANGVEFVDRDKANYTLHLGPETFKRRNLSIGSNARAAEFELEMSTTLRVTDNSGSELMAATDLSVFRIMTSDVNNITGKVEESRLLQREMRVDLVQQIMRQVRFLASSGAG